MKRGRLASGRFWMFFWLFWLAVVLVWGTLTILFWLESTKNINALSIAALLMGAGGGFQATLGMRKADPDDPL